MKPTVLFLGTPQFAAPILEELQKHFEVVGVVTQPDRPVGRKLVLTPPPIKTKAEELGLKIYQPEKASEIPHLIQEEFDFLVTAAYGEYLPSEVLHLAKKDSLNVHPSLLPKYRGATPMQSALLNGEQKTGVSIIRMAKQMDAGKIFAQSELEINPEMKYPELEKACSEIGAKLITEVIQKHDQITPVDQDPSQVTHCHKINKEDGLIHWGKETAEQIHNKLRAFTPWPGTYTFFKEQKLSLLEFSPSYPSYPPYPSNPPPPPPGTIFENNKQIFIQTKQGSLELKTIQLAGKNPTDIKSFVNGHHDFLGTKL